MKKESYFKRIKEPIAKAEEAAPLIKETRTYLLIALGISMLFSLLGIIIPVLKTVFEIIGLIGMFAAFYFGIILYSMTRVVKRLKNLTCDKCGSKLGDPENTTYQEISRRWQDSNDSKKAESKLYVTVQFTCKCPKCGTVKSFKETLCSGSINVTNYSTRDNIISTQKLVDDYLDGLIHA